MEVLIFSMVEGMDMQSSDVANLLKKGKSSSKRKGKRVNVKGVSYINSVR